MNEAFKEEIKKIAGGRFLFDEPMSGHTSFRIGGPADIWFEPEDIEGLRDCLIYARGAGVPVFVSGRGTNLLVNDAGIRGLVINMGSPTMKEISTEGAGLTASSAVSVSEFLDFCGDNGLGGAEFLEGIPGSIGGAVMTNAASRHYEKREVWHSIGGFVEAARIMDYGGSIRILQKDEIEFAYKHTGIEGLILLDIRLLLRSSDREEAGRERRKYLEIKKRTQDLSAPSAGCVFKNPPGIDKSAGMLIDGCGLKGARVGGAAISERHANFIVNRGGARAGDVTALMELAVNKVREMYGIELSPEIKIV